MLLNYRSYEERTPDAQYAKRVRTILKKGILAKTTPQGVGALTCFGTLKPMVFNPENGLPFITERNISFWRKPIAELIAFIHGARTIDQLNSFGCNFWDDYRGRGVEFGLEPDDLGPGSYGAAFHDFEIPEGGTLNQFAQLVEQIKQFPDLRTHLVSPWKPYYTAAGPNRKVIVAPCHGWVHVRILNGQLHMEMKQRSADILVGVPSNMVQYSALHLMLCQVTGYPPGNYVHSFSDAHIYENQVESAEKLLKRAPRTLPILRLDQTITNLFDFRPEHFTLEEYCPHPGMKIPYLP